ncbi:MAG: aldo/keto reductase [Actinomycetota bacterium]
MCSGGFIAGAKEKNVAIIAAGVFNSGILANPVKGATYNYSPASDEILAKAVRMNEVLREFGVSISQAALQFPLRNPAVTAVLAGCRTGQEVRENVAAFDAEIPKRRGTRWHACNPRK